MDWELRKQAEKMQSEESSDVVKDAGRVIYYVITISAMSLFWMIDSLTGNRWDNTTWGVAFLVVIITPLVMRSVDIHKERNAIRDRRAIRIEIKIDELAKEIRNLKNS